MDISSFLLVEGCADSEADCEFLKLCQDVIMGCEYVDGDDDDAESCSCDSSYKLGFVHVLDHDDDEEFDDDGDKSVQYHSQNWRSSKIWLGDGEAESKEGTDVLSKKMVDQMDDGLFWQTCMAEGYP